MSRFDGYFLRQLLVLFCFFALILVSVFWISRAVSLFDRLIGNGQSALVFLEFTALSLPTLVRTVMPMAAFGAAVYVTNRLTRESEMIVMLSAGVGPWRLARPVLTFGLIVAAMMLIVTLVLRPMSIERLDKRETEVSQDLAAQLLRDGRFMHPVDGVTFYIGSIDTDGTMHDVFLSDRRKPDRSTSYSAREAYLVWSDGAPNLVMLDGIALQSDHADNTLSTTWFRDTTYSIADMTGGGGDLRVNPRAFPTLALMTDIEGLSAQYGIPIGVLVEELHQRFSWALICVAVSFVGFSVLMVGGFSRFGLWPQVATAFVILLVLEGLRGVAAPMVERAPHLWPLLYVPSLMGFVIGVLCLRVGGRPLRRIFGGPARAVAQG
ncbi:MAG: LPS export ABC transporter permease LptF [Marinibacterium sp.]|nr:LPS export ABC transporter permease LptF [Marinibacterium sp.]